MVYIRNFQFPTGFSRGKDSKSESTKLFTLSIPYRILTRNSRWLQPRTGKNLSIPYRILTRNHPINLPTALFTFQFPTGFSQ